jgi:rare lipoprotein A
MHAPLILLLLWMGVTATESSLPKPVKQSGTASWYGAECRKTASGEHYNPESLTAAHRSLPFGTMVEVRNVANGRSVVVRINNRGPYCKGRIIDVSKAAAQQLEMIHSGTTKVELVVQK